MLYFFKTGQLLNLDKPQSFTEKVQWLKLYDRRPEYTMMVDKYAVKNYVAKVIGLQYVIPTLGVWDKPKDIDFDSLPSQFVLKTTNGGGGGDVVVCLDKSSFDKNNALKVLAKAMGQNVYKRYREWPYKGVVGRVIAEEYLQDTDGHTSELVDYKFYCFDGVPTFCQVIQTRSTNETIDFFDMKWNHQSFCGLNPKARPAVVTPLKPQHFAKMVDIATKLSYGIRFCRIDLYDTQKQPYFGEITFYPASGLGIFTPNEYDYVLGGMINLG